ncbi:MAG: sialate O-acetylesterase [Bacteroidales bacterium]|nr:sialate O-acetylesterase [Bacteroidales bacterium]
MKRVIFSILIFIALTFSIKATDTLKVACVGNSVTYGAGIAERETMSYPAQLQQMLGGGYEVKNFGHSGATLLKKGHNPYWKLKEFEEAVAFNPDIVIFHLGLNDTDPRNWPRYRDDFTKDYKELIDTFKAEGAEVWICRLTPIFHPHPRFKSGTRDWFWQIQKQIERVAQTSNVGLIDLHSTLYNRPDLFPDALHPTAEGATIIAKKVYTAISKEYAGLHIAPIFSDNMVLQRSKPIIFWGKGTPNSEITITFNETSKSSDVLPDGSWEITFPSMAAGGPHTITFDDGVTLKTITNILIGEVWLCSGQSNMAFQLKHSHNAQEAIQHAINNQIRLFDMKEIAATNNEEWDESILQKTNQLQYYKPTSWVESTKENASAFSAVGYYFGAMLQKELGVPVGLINNAIGGSTTESWIDRHTLEHNPQLVDMLYNWANNDFIDSWVRDRASLNIKQANNTHQRHPYHPAYLYESAIEPISKLNIAGAIWYQGESNAHNVELHEVLLPSLVESWRKVWGNQFPFYYAQLSSMKYGRETWPHFRDSQRRLLNKIAHAGMAVTSDLGADNDVHPTQKKQVGERLARWALAESYNKKIVKSGPLFDSICIDGNRATVTFLHANRIQTSDGKTVREVEIAGKDKVYKPANVIIKNNTLEVWSNDISHPYFIRYGWNSFTEGNLVNEEFLPASTFSNETNRDQ